MDSKELNSEIIKMKRQGWTWRDIAERFSLSIDNVKQRARKLGLYVGKQWNTLT